MTMPFPPRVPTGVVIFQYSFLYSGIFYNNSLICYPYTGKDSKIVLYFSRIETIFLHDYTNWDNFYFMLFNSFFRRSRLFL